jgi:L-ribulose-5-phosphate 4-epimerase
MLNDLKEQVWQANLALVKLNLVTATFGNVSGFDRKKGFVAIKPSGVSYEALKPSDIVLVDVEGKIVEGELNPSSDTPTHIELYKAFKQIGGATHTHSEYATMFAQACREIPCLGTTHADYFNGAIPVTRYLTEKEVKENYERNTGKVIVERFTGLNPLEMPAVLVAGHGPFAWGETPEEAVEHNLIMEKVAKMALGTFLANSKVECLPEYILRKHYQRKHGPKAYYGQKKQGVKK